MLQAHLNNEKRTLSELKQVYTQALKDCEQRIKQLSMRTDMENIQSIVYQKNYQQAIKGQLEGILEQLHSNEFATVSDFLARSYQDGYIGAMYDISGQGIPLVIPLDQEQVVKAIQTDTKLSKTLYNRLGEDVNKLKTSIRAEVSRGIANGATWNEVASQIAMNFKNTPFNVAYNNAVRIARTEGHRIQIQAADDAQHKAKESGADIVKQWDASLDGRTRKTHRKLDGQIRELDEPFEVDGKKAMRPADFGDPAEDINCRCALLQRAKWALDEAELEVLKSRAEYYGLDKTDSFEDYKKKYLKASERVRQDALKMNDKGTSLEKVINKNDEEIQFKLDGMSEEGQKYIKDKIALLSSEYNTSIVDIQYDKTLKYVGGKVDAYTGTVMQIKDSHSIEHEFFHTLDHSHRLKYKDSVETNEDFWKESKKLFTEYKKAAINNRNIRISEYSLENVDEFMAEAFAAAKGGTNADTFGVGSESPYTQKALSIIDKYFKKDTLEKAGKSSTMNMNLQLFAKDSKDYKTIILPKDEYAYVMSELNTHLSNEQRNQKVVKKAIGNYIYTIENNGFDEYRIIGKEAIDTDAMEWWNE